MSANLVPFSSDGGFTTAGNITTASYASPAPTISGFSSVSADNFRLMAGTISGGVVTVVDDGINSIALAPGAQMDVFGFPFSGGGVRGQLTVSDVTTPSEANGTWYYQSINTYTYQIYTDSTYSTLVDATSWSAYTGGGSVAIAKQVPAANIIINSNGYFSKFDNTGDLTLPGDLLIANNASITTTNATGNVVGKSINIQAGAADQGDYYTTAGGNLNLIGGLGAGNDGGGGGPGGAVNITSGVSADVAGRAGNVTINTGSNTWTFDYTGMLTVPGEGVINSVDDTVTLRSFNTSTGNANSVYLGTSGGLGFNDGEIGGNWLEIFRSGIDPQLATTGNLLITADSTNTAPTWTFAKTGNLSAPGNISTVGNVTAANFIGNINLTGNVTGTSANVTLVSGSYSWTFDNTGNLTVPAGGDILLANTQSTISAAGNVTAGNLSAGGSANLSNVTVNSYTYVPQLWFKGTLSGDQSLTTSADTVILYNTNSDPLSWGTTASSNGRVVPNKAGWYEVISRAQFSAVAGNVNAQINHQILVSGVQQAISQVPNNAVVGAGVAVVATAMVNLNGTTDYITTSCYTTVAGQTCVGSTSTMLLVKWIST